MNYINKGHNYLYMLKIIVVIGDMEKIHQSKEDWDYKGGVEGMDCSF